MILKTSGTKFVLNQPVRLRHGQRVGAQTQGIARRPGMSANDVRFKDAKLLHFYTGYNVLAIYITLFVDYCPSSLSEPDSELDSVLN